VNAVPPGAQGLMLQPFWNPGIKVPGPEAKGAIIGFGDVHNRAHLYRAILEGLAYALREAKERIERRSGRPITRLRVSGGGSQSDAAMQITANIFNLPCERPHLYETSGLGAAMLAAVSLKLHPDFATAVARHDRIGAVFEPSPSMPAPTTGCTGASTAACTGGCSRCTATSRSSPAIRPAWTTIRREALRP
jgi:sugar (pentulose or hexulose) kinase